jgi:hypothetical protein
MSNDGWGKEWPNLDGKPDTWPNAWPETIGKLATDPINPWTKDLKVLDKTTTEIRELNNLKPTHDPYTNPGAFVYYECNCGAVLDPKTKSFASLNNAASMAGWKIRFGEVGYIPYCPKCGEGVE